MIGFILPVSKNMRGQEMKQTIIITAITWIILIASMTRAYAASIHTTVNITHVTSYPTGKAAITMNPIGPCSSGSAVLGDPVNPGMLAVALSAQTTGKQVRMRIDGDGDFCTIGYITIQPQ